MGGTGAPKPRFPPDPSWPCHAPTLHPNAAPQCSALLGGQPSTPAPPSPRVTPLSGRMLRLSHPWGQPRTPHGLLKHGRHSCTPAVGTQGWEGPGSVAGLSQMCKSWWQCHASAVTRSPQASSSISAPQGATPCRGGAEGQNWVRVGSPGLPTAGWEPGGGGTTTGTTVPCPGLSTARPRVSTAPRHRPGVSTAPG